jgi:hypothetical protein
MFKIYKGTLKIAMTAPSDLVVGESKWVGAIHIPFQYESDINDRKLGDEEILQLAFPYVDKNVSKIVWE